MPAEYPRASEEFIRNKINPDMFDDLFIPSYNLSCVLSDVDGRVSTGILSQVLDGLEIVSPGVLVLGEDASEGNTPGILIEEEYSVDTSQKAFEVYTQLKSSDESLVVHLNDSEIGVNSLLLSLSLDLPPTLRNAINTLYIECLSVYRELLAAGPDTPLTVSQEDIKRITRNSRWISFRLESMNRVPVDLIEVVRDVQTTMFFIGTLDTIFNSKKNLSLRDLTEVSDSLDSYNTPYITKDYTIRDGDTIHMIAQRELGDASKAIDIITLNDLQYPFIRKLSEPVEQGVKTMGDVIQIPQFEAQVQTPIIPDLGTDLKLVDRDGSGGDLEADVYGDLQLVTGIDCLIQDMNSRFATELNTLPFHPTYGNGLKAAIGSRKDQGWDQKARVEASKVLKLDSRITDILSLDVYSISQGVMIDAVLEVSGATVPVNYRYLAKLEEV